MADELDSGSSVGYRVWVQVPSPASYLRKESFETKGSFLYPRPFPLIDKRRQFFI